MPDNNLQFLLHKNLMHAVQAAVGTEIFRHTYVLNKQSGEIIDTMQDGRVSCAYFVSGMLSLFMMIDHAHSTVPTTVQKMEENGWFKIDQPRPGAVVHWPADAEGHQHLGFYISEHVYISNYSEEGRPQTHGPERPAGRRPDAFYWHSKLDDANAGQQSA